MTSASDELPVITPEIIDDDQALAEVVDLLVYKDDESRRWCAESAVYEAVLKETLDPGAWQIFLRLEELGNARWSELLLVVARKAFNDGRCVGPPRE